ncbi:hypothetical protein [Palaeococcus sp. (in: euryarchaeotes)]
MKSRVLLVAVFVMFLVGNMLGGGLAYVRAEPSIDVDSSIRDYVTVELGNSDYEWIKIGGISKGEKYYLKIRVGYSWSRSWYLTVKVYAPNGDIWRESCSADGDVSSISCSVNLLWPGKWKFVDEDSGFMVIFNVPPLKAVLDETFYLRLVGPPLSSNCWSPPPIKLSLFDPQNKPVSSMPPSSLCSGRVSVKDMIKKNVNSIGRWELKLEVIDRDLLKKGVHNEYSIPLVAYANPVVVETPSEIESIAKESDDYFMVHFRNEEDSTKGDYLVKLPCYKFKAKLYDPNGVLYDTTTATGSGGECTIKLKVPDKSRAGYWKIVVYPEGHEEYSNSAKFYVSPEKTKAVNVQAICGPGLVVLLAVFVAVVLTGGVKHE